MTVAGTISDVATIAENVLTGAHAAAPLVEAGLDAMALWPGFGSAALASAAIKALDGRYAIEMTALEALVKASAGPNAATGSDLSRALTELDMHVTPGLPNSPALAQTAGLKT
jgi:hypothetical protein